MKNDEILKKPFFFRQKGIHRYYTDVEVLEAMNQARQDELKNIRELLIDFYKMLEKEGKFPNSAGWADFWADKYLKKN